VEFACAVETDPTNLSLELEPQQPEIAMPVMTTELKLPNPTPPIVTELAELTPITPLIAVPLVSIPGPVPEPGTLLLALSGTAFLGLLMGMRSLRPQV